MNIKPSLDSFPVFSALCFWKCVFGEYHVCLILFSYFMEYFKTWKYNQVNDIDSNIIIFGNGTKLNWNNGCIEKCEIWWKWGESVIFLFTENKKVFMKVKSNLAVTFWPLDHEQHDHYRSLNDESRNISQDSEITSLYILLVQIPSAILYSIALSWEFWLLLPDCSKYLCIWNKFSNEWTLTCEHKL